MDYLTSLLSGERDVVFPLSRPGNQLRGLVTPSRSHKLCDLTSLRGLFILGSITISHGLCNSYYCHSFPMNMCELCSSKAERFWMVA